MFSPGIKEQNKKFLITLTQEEHAWIKTMAAKSNMTMVDYIRELIRIGSNYDRPNSS